MAIPRVFPLELIRPMQQPAPPVPPVFVTRGTMELLQRIQGRDGFLHKTAADLSQLVVGGSSDAEQKIICALPAEVPAVVFAQGLPQKAMDHLSFFCRNVFVAGGIALPTPLRRISQFLAHPTDHALSWIISVLPTGLHLELNGVRQNGLTSVANHGPMYCGMESMPDMGLVYDGPQRSVSCSDTYLSGGLWQDDMVLLPVNVMIHEASHVVHQVLLRRWIDRNAARNDEARNPAFIRHCQLGLDGGYQVDFTFATLFLELAACQATGMYFSMIQSVFPHDDDVLMQVATGFSMAFGYLTDPRFQPFLEGARIPPITTPNDMRAIVTNTRQFTSIVFDDV